MSQTDTDIEAARASESYALVCRQSYPPSDLMSVLAHLRRTGRTGTLSLALHHGGIARIEFCEEHVIVPPAP